MSNYDFSIYKFSADILEMSARDFKKLVRKRYGLTAKKATALYKHAHGIETSESEEKEESKEPSKDTHEHDIPTTKESSEDSE